MEINNRRNSTMENTSTSQTREGTPRNPPRPPVYRAVPATGGTRQYSDSAVQSVVCHSTNQSAFTEHIHHSTADTPRWWSSLYDQFNQDLLMTSLAVKDITWRVSELISNQEMNVVIKTHRLYELQRENESYLLKCSQLLETAKFLGNQPHEQICFEISIVNYQAHLTHRSIAGEQERLGKMMENYRAPMGI